MSLDLMTLQAELDHHRSTVDVDYFDLSLRELARMVAESEIRIAPEYQRQFRWKDNIQSALVESFLLGLPVPAIFVATNPDGTWEVVDGLQRICTLIRFMGLDAPESEILHFSSNPLRLTELKTLKSFDSLTYSDLPRPIRLTFDKKFMRVQVLSDRSNTDVRFELFRRLNAGAVELTPQEIRACVFRGSLNQLIENLAQYDKYQEILKLRESDKHKGVPEEVVLKFFAYLDRAETFDGKVTEFLNEYMKENLDPNDLEAKRQIFIRSVDFLANVLNGPFLREKTTVTPLNHFEAVLVGIARVIQAGKAPSIPPAGWVNDPTLLSFSTKGTNTRKSLLGRVGRAEELFSPS